MPMEIYVLALDMHQNVAVSRFLTTSMTYNKICIKTITTGPTSKAVNAYYSRAHFKRFLTLGFSALVIPGTMTVKENRYTPVDIAHIYMQITRTT